MSASNSSQIARAILPFVILLSFGYSTAFAETDVKVMLEDKTSDVFQALMDQDTAFLASVYSDEYLITAQSFHVADKKQLIESQEVPEGSTFEVTDWRAIHSGDTLVALYKLTWTFGDGGSNEVRFTDVWVNRDGAWEILASHASQISLK